MEKALITDLDEDWKSIKEKKVLKYPYKSFFRGAIIVVPMLLSGAANADEVHVAGLTEGRFNAQAFGLTNTLLGLTYDSSVFDNSTVGNQLDLGGNPVPGLNIDNLGSFSLDLSDNTYNGNNFNLMVTFLAPTTITGGGSAIYTDQLFGTVLNGNGGVFIDFDNTPQVFTFTNATATGSFSMFVNDVSIAPGQSSSLTGHIMGSQQPVPEPATVVGIACGFLGLFRKLGRRKA